MEGDIEAATQTTQNEAIGASGYDTFHKGRLPNEMLELIVGAVHGDHNEEVFQFSDDPRFHNPQQKEIPYESLYGGVYSLSLVNHRIGEVAQKMLFSSPMLTDRVGSDNDLANSDGLRLLKFTHTLITRPDLAACIENAYLGLTNDDKRGPWGANHAGSSQALRYHEDVFAFLRNSSVPWIWHRRWLGELMLSSRELFSLVLLQARSLRRLCISFKDFRCLVPGRRGTVFETFINRDSLLDPKPLKLHSLPEFQHLKNLEYLKMTSVPLNQVFAWYQDTILPGNILDIPMELSLPAPSFPKRQLQHLRIDCRFYSRQINLHLSPQTQYCKFGELPQILLSLPNLRSLELYAESGNLELPENWRRWNYFPRCVGAFAFMDIEKNSLEELVRCIEPACSQLQSLAIPGGTWTLPMTSDAHLPSFTSFYSVEKITVPKAALVRNARASVARSGPSLHSWMDPSSVTNFRPSPGKPHLDPLLVFPMSLRHLKVFEADEEIFSWLAELYEHVGGGYTSLNRVEILMRHDYNYSDVYLYWNEHRLVSELRDTSKSLDIHFTIGVDDNTPAYPDFMKKEVR